MTRIVAGVAGGRRLTAPPGRETRPTSDRVREALFASLRSEVGELEGLDVLDLYAGSGAVGCEALSRGARSVLFVESARNAVACIRRNLRELGLAGGEVRAADVERLVSAPADHAYDIAFLDPPYAVSDERVRGVLSALLRHGWLVPEAVVVVERATRGGPFTWPDGFEPLRSRRYGETTLWYGLAGTEDWSSRQADRSGEEEEAACTEPSARGRSTR